MTMMNDPGRTLADLEVDLAISEAQAEAGETVAGALVLAQIEAALAKLERCRTTEFGGHIATRP